MPTRTGYRRLAVVVSGMLAAAALGSWQPTVGATVAVAPVVPVDETTPVSHAGDAADDPAIWVHPTQSSASLIIGNDTPAPSASPPTGAV